MGQGLNPDPPTFSQLCKNITAAWLSAHPLGGPWKFDPSVRPGEAVVSCGKCPTPSTHRHLERTYVLLLQLPTSLPYWKEDIPSPSTTDVAADALDPLWMKDKEKKYSVTTTLWNQPGDFPGHHSSFEDMASWGQRSPLITGVYLLYWWVDGVCLSPCGANSAFTIDCYHQLSCVDVSLSLSLLVISSSSSSSPCLGMTGCDRAAFVTSTGARLLPLLPQLLLLTLAKGNEIPLSRGP